MKPFKWGAQAMAPAKSRATQKLAEAMRRDVLTPEKSAAMLRKMGPQATIADTGGENVLGLLDATVQRPGAIRNKAIAMTTGRQVGQKGRIMDALTDTIADERNFYQTLDDVGKAMNKKAAPLYKQAFQSNQDMSSRTIDRILKTPAGKNALAGARERMANQMTLMAKADPELTEQVRFLAPDRKSVV